VDEVDSTYTVDGVIQFLEEERQYFTVDFRNKTAVQTNTLLNNATKNKRLCLFIPKVLPEYVESILYNLYDNSFVQIIDKDGKFIKIAFGEEITFLVLVTRQTFEALLPNNNFERFIFSMPFHLSDEPTFYAQLMQRS
jgi:hypothetical protein